MSAPPFLPMAASLVITKEEIEIFIYQQRERERWCGGGIQRLLGGKEREESRRGGISNQHPNELRARPEIKKCGLCKRANEGTDERAGAQDNGGIIAAYLFSRTDTI